MQTLLIFPPPASPTYIPLGLASLAAYLRVHAPGTDLSVLDLNIATWQSFTQASPQGANLLAFMHDRESFYDPARYTSHQTAWAGIHQQIMRLHENARHYLDTGQWSDNLDSFLGPTLARIMTCPPDLLGFSVMFLDQMAFALAMSRRIDETRGLARRPYCVLGGAALCAVQVTDLMQHAPFVDAVLPGEGEVALGRLCQGLAPERVPGLITRTSDQPDAAVLIPDVALTTLPVPDFGLLPLADYASPEPVLPVVLSRHCTWARCRFCAHNHSFGSHRQKDMTQFVDELEFLSVRHHCRHFYLADQYVPTATLISLSNTLIQRGLDIQFQIMARPTRDLTLEVLEHAAAAGCCWISWGVESGAQRLLDLVRKGTRREHIERVLQDSHCVGITNLLMMIFGLPTSTAQDLDETLDMLGTVYPYADAITTSSFVLFDNTPFAQNAQQYGLAVTGRQPLLNLNGQCLYTTRLDHQNLAADGHLTAPLGPMEILRWNQRRRWYGPAPFKEKLPCEHLLLYSAHQQAQDQHRPVLPPAPRKVA